jgi:outer membrane lipoprotein SlyB
METNQRRLHPLIAAAAVSVILASMVGIAVFMDWLPRSDSAATGIPAAPVAETAPEPEATAPASPPPKPAVRAEAPVRHKPVAAKPKPVPEPEEAAAVPQPVAAAEPTPVAALPTCGNCGVVEYVQPREQPASPGAGMIGTVVGGVVGGVLGNQVGSGKGKKLATAAGAVGGALAGRRIEQSRRGQAMSYEIGVRFEDGRLQTFTQDTPPNVSAGQRVRVTAGTVFPE